MPMNNLVTTALKTPPDVGVAMRIADSFGVNRARVLKRINCPTLIIASAKSGSLAQQQAQAKQISGARFEKVEDAAHAVFLDQPDRFNELVTSFVAKLPPNGDVQVAGTVTTPPPFVDKPVILTLDQYRTAPKIVKTRLGHKRVARVPTPWHKLVYGWVAEHVGLVKKK